MIFACRGWNGTAFRKIDPLPQFWALQESITSITPEQGMSTKAAVARSNTLEKIAARQDRVGIVGMGYVGLPLALLYSENRFTVTGFDIDQKKIDTLNSGGSYMVKLSATEVQAAQKHGFRATAIDNRQSAKADCLWDEAAQKLYVVSHLFTTNGSSSSSSSNWGRLYRFSYSSGPKRTRWIQGF